MIGRTGGGTERTDLFVEKLQQRLRVEQRLCLLIEKGLVCGTSAFGDEQELVGIARHRLDVNLRRQIRTCIPLFIHVERRDLAVTQIGFDIGFEDARARAGSSLPPIVQTRCPFLAKTSAVPVSWHIGSTPPAAMLAFFNISKATNLSFEEASASSTIVRSCRRWDGRSRCDASRKASAASSV